MDIYIPDIDAGQIVRWLIDEQRQGTLMLNTFVSRSYVVEEMKDTELQRLGEEESEDLSDTLAIGVLELRPPAESDGWILRVRAEDRIGLRLPEDEDIPEGEEEIDLQTFEAQFILPEHVTLDVSLEAENPQAKARFTRLFKHMLKDEHKATS